MASTNGLESHWALFKRGLDGIYHHVSVEHPNRYSQEFSVQHSRHPLDTVGQMSAMVRAGEDWILHHDKLIA